MNKPKGRTALPRISAWLLENTGSTGPGYDALRRRALSGLIPCEWDSQGRIFVRDEHLPVVAESLGLTLRNSVAA